MDEVPDFTPEPREIPVELTEGFPHAVYPPPPVKFAPWAQQLDTATRETLIEFARHASIGEPHVSDPS